MTLCNFLHFNNECPVCGKELTLYMSVSRSTLWKATQTKSGTYQFKPFMLKMDLWDANDYMMLYDFGDSFQTEFNSSKMGQASKTWQLFFLKICGNGAFSDNKYDYDINWYDACYYRSSPYFEFKSHSEEHKKWQLEVMVEEQTNLVNRDESFLFKTMNQEKVEKVYALNLDYENKCTNLWYYSATEEQRNDPDYEAKEFEQKNLPLLPVRPDFRPEARDKLISRFESWIILS